MKTLILLAMFVFASSVYGIDIDKFKFATSAKESLNQPGARGAANERTIYQFTPTTWIMFSRVPMEKADADEVERVFYCTMAWIESALRAQHRALTVRAFALAWVEGPYRKHYSHTADQYAGFIENLVNAAPP